MPFQASVLFLQLADLFTFVKNRNPVHGCNEFTSLFNEYCMPLNGAMYTSFVVSDISHITMAHLVSTVSKTSCQNVKAIL